MVPAAFDRRTSVERWSTKCTLIGNAVSNLVNAKRKISFRSGRLAPRTKRLGMYQMCLSRCVCGGEGGPTCE